MVHAPYLSPSRSSPGQVGDVSAELENPFQYQSNSTYHPQNASGRARSLSACFSSRAPLGPHPSPSSSRQPFTVGFTESPAFIPCRDRLRGPPRPRHPCRAHSAAGPSFRTERHPAADRSTTSTPLMCDSTSLPILNLALLSPLHPRAPALLSSLPPSHPHPSTPAPPDILGSFLTPLPQQAAIAQPLHLAARLHPWVFETVMPQLSTTDRPGNVRADLHTPAFRHHHVSCARSRPVPCTGSFRRRAWCCPGFSHRTRRPTRWSADILQAPEAGLHRRRHLVHGVGPTEAASPNPPRGTKHRRRGRQGAPGTPSAGPKGQDTRYPLPSRRRKQPWRTAGVPPPPPPRPRLKRLSIWLAATRPASPTGQAVAILAAARAYRALAPGASAPPLRLPIRAARSPPKAVTSSTPPDPARPCPVRAPPLPFP